MSSCPACNKPVDPLRSRFVGVIDGKVVGFCSAECATKAAPASAATVTHSGRVVAVASAAAAASAEVLAKKLPPPTPQTPASGVPVVLGAPPKSSGVPISLESGPLIEIVREPASGVVQAVVPAKDDRSGRAKHPDEISIAAFWSADKEREKSGAVVMPKDSSKDSKDTGAKAAVRPSDEPSGRHARAPSEPELELPRKSRLPLLLIVLIVLGAGGFALYRMLAKGDAAAANRSSMREPPPPPIATRDDGTGRRPFDRAAPGAAEAPGAVRSQTSDPAADVAHATAQAREILGRGLTSTSPRIQHLAAAALSRTQDAAARASLTAQLGQETSEIAKLDLAYALARSGDPQGGALLAAGLRSQRGEVRDESARLLALLGDARAIPHLLDLLAVQQRHLGGAEQLARLAEPHGLQALQQLRADPRASSDDKARATIALGLAGKVEPDALRALLTDPHQNMFAAAALAEHRDPAATPVLVEQLASPALRVRAARALRRLDTAPGPTLTTVAHLPMLVAALGQGGDPNQISAAEAILLLTGPAAWASFE